MGQLEIKDGAGRQFISAFEDDKKGLFVRIGPDLMDTLNRKPLNRPKVTAFVLGQRVFRHIGELLPDGNRTSDDIVPLAQSLVDERRESGRRILGLERQEQFMDGVRSIAEIINELGSAAIFREPTRIESGGQDV